MAWRLLPGVLGVGLLLLAAPLFQPRYRVEQVWAAPPPPHPLAGLRLQGVAEYGGLGPGRMDIDRFLEVKCSVLPGRGWRLPGTSTGREPAPEPIWTRRGFQVTWEANALRLRLPGRVLRFDEPGMVRELVVPAQDVANGRVCR
ncbi:hypothetical protein [Deinococcus sp. YIM 77859]|uniref:hypothetical protein n=1 Tax=Deinococcus sp. YIM 77859 TaxID=1540221 RepID=UPI00054F563C|nr:hypothetical protein [Deinococcus sp. YIM 77859]